MSDGIISKGLITEVTKALVVGLVLGFLGMVGWIAKEQFTISYNISRISTTLELLGEKDSAQIATNNKLIYNLEERNQELSDTVLDLSNTVSDLEERLSTKEDLHRKEELSLAMSKVLELEPKREPLLKAVREPRASYRVPQKTFKDFDRDVRMQIQEQMQKK